MAIHSAHRLIGLALAAQASDIARRMVATPVQAGSDMFYRFKAGKSRLGYPLALGIYDTIRGARLVDFDAVIPVPLSPDKVTAGEFNRPLVLVREVAHLLGVRTAQALSLREAISRRQLRNAGVAVTEFERRYMALLEVQDRPAQLSRAALIDDVCDHGSTLRCAAQMLWQVAPELKIVAVSAGQVIVKEAVRKITRLVA